MARCENPLREISEPWALESARCVYFIPPYGKIFLIANSTRLARKSFCCNMSDPQDPQVSPILSFRLNSRNSMKTKDRLLSSPIQNCKICTMIVQLPDFGERVRAPYPTVGGSIAKPRPAGQAML